MKRRWLVVVALVGIWWLRRGEEAAHPHNVQAAVLADGFALLSGKRVIEFDRGGTKQHEMQVKHDGDMRFAGTRVGPAIGWKDGKKMKLAILDGEGEGDVSTWGKSVKQLCDGVATNEHRFGIGWLESDGRVWFVHGPMNRLLEGTVEPTAIAAKASWCGVASAEQNVALLWREGQRLMMNFCTRKECTSLVAKVPIEPSEKLLGYGCVRDACLFATRDKHGTTKLHRVTDRGRAIVKTLENAKSDSPVAVVGAGTRAFAIAYVANDNNATIQRVSLDGAFTSVYHFDKYPAPSLAWAAGKLFVAMPSREAWVLDMPQ